MSTHLQYSEAFISYQYFKFYSVFDFPRSQVLIFWYKTSLRKIYGDVNFFSEV